MGIKKVLSGIKHRIDKSVDANRDIPIETAWERPVYMPRGGDINAGDNGQPLAAASPAPVAAGPGYNPQPPDTGSMALPNRAQRLGAPMPAAAAPAQPYPVADELQARAYSNLGYNPPAGINAPTTQPPAAAPAGAGTLAAQYMAKATPVEDLTRDRTVGPLFGAPSGPPMPASATVTYDKHGHPTGATGGQDDIENNRAYLDALEAYKATNHNSRGKSALIGLARGLYTGGLVGGLYGAASHAVDPAQDEKFQQQQDIRSGSRRLAGSIAAAEARSKVNAQDANATYDRARAATAGEPTYSVQKTNTGLIQVPTRGSGGAKIVYDPNDPTKQAKAPPAASTGTKTKTEYVPDPRDPKNPNLHIKRVSKLDADGKPMDSVDTSEEYIGGHGWVPAGAGANASAIQGRFNADQAFRKTEFEDRKAEREQRQTEEAHQRFLERRKTQGELEGQIQSGRQIIGDTKAQIAELQAKRDAAEGPYEKGEYDKLIKPLQKTLTGAVAAARKAAGTLKTGHSDMYDVSYGPDSIPYYALKPWKVSNYLKAKPGASESQIQAAMQDAKESGITAIDDRKK